MNNAVQQWNQISDELRKEILKARKRGMNKAAMKIRNKTRSLIKSAFPASTKPNSKYSDKIIEGARVSKYRESTLAGEAVAGVHIMGVRNKSSQTFKLRFFEGGTVERFTKSYKRKNRVNGGMHNVKAHRTGSIKGKGFFSSAVQSELQNAPSVIEQELIKAVIKCNNG